MKSKEIPARAWVELISIQDKSTPMFRAKYPTEHHVRIVLGTEKSNLVVREKVYLDKAEAKEQYATLKHMLGIK